MITVEEEEEVVDGQRWKGRLRLSAELSGVGLSAARLSDFRGC